MGTKKTYLAAGGLICFGGVCLMAMHGLGKPGVNMGCLQQGAALDTHFFFPIYAEGGYSGDLYGTALSIKTYQRMPQLALQPAQSLAPALVDGTGCTAVDS